MAKKKTQNEAPIDVLILHGMDEDLVDDLKTFLRSLELDAATVLDLSSNGNNQNVRVNYQIKNCGIPLVLLSFDEQEIHGTKARINVYDEITRCQTFRPKDTLVLREVKNDLRVDLPSNVEGTLVIIEFDRSKLHKLFPQLIIELKGRKMVENKYHSAFDEKVSIGGSLSRFLDQMDVIWEKEFDIASYKIDRNDSSTLNKFQNTLDKFFLEYWKVFNALIRENKKNGELRTICDAALTKSLELAADVWEAVAITTLETAEDLKERKSKDKKFDLTTFEKYYRMANNELKKGTGKHEVSARRIEHFKNCIDHINTLISKVGI